MDKMEFARQEQTRKWAKVHEIAFKQGLVLVSLSQRRSIVVELTTNGGLTAIPHGLNKTGRFTRIEGSVKFGPARYDECIAYIVEHVDPVPEEFYP